MSESIFTSPLHQNQGITPRVAEIMTEPVSEVSVVLDLNVKDTVTHAHTSTASGQLPTLRDLVRHTCSINASESLCSTFSQFSLIPHDYMAVLDGDRLLGICSRREIGMILGSGFGRELFGKKPVREHMEPKCLTITEGTPIVEVLSTVFSVEDQYYFNDIVLVDRVGCYVGLISVLTMIRLQHRLLLELNLELEEYFKLFNTSSDLMCIFDQDGFIKKINPAGSAILGYSQQEMLGRQLMEFVHPDDLQKTLDEAEWQSSHKDTMNIENRYLHKDGTVCWFSWQLFSAGDEKLTYATGRNISVRKQYERELEETRKAAESANRAKSEFLSNMSHEIRTPMNAVLGLAQVLEKGALLPDQREMVQRIRSAGHSLLGILNDILDFSKIEAGQLRIEMRPFELPALLNQLDSLMGCTARSKGLTLHIAVPPEVTGALVGDDLRLGQILINLVGNAIKFTEQGEVEISVIPVELTGTTSRLRFQVRDTGVGIAPEVLTTLFQPFTQADDSITRRFGGTGLGLSICKRLVELMNGNIGVESSEGIGSSFWFEIPFERTTFIATSPATREEALPDGPRLTGRRVLVVDDSELNQIVVTSALALEGAVTETANDGQQALDILRARSHEFDIVLMDVQMPVMDGLTATRALRCEPLLSELPVIAFTAGVLQEERQKALDAGVNDFLPKPVNLEEMVAVLLRWSTGKEMAMVPVTAQQRVTVISSGGQLPETFSGLDISKGISLCGSEKLHRELVVELVRTHGDDAARIREALATDDLPLATRTAHTLKGVAGNLAAVTVYRIADELEVALKHDQREFFDPMLCRLAEAMTELQVAARLLKNESPPQIQPVSAARTEVGDVSPLFEELLVLLQERRLAARRVMRKLEEKLSGTIVSPEVTLLSVAIDRLEFVDAHSMALHLAHRLTDFQNQAA
jgi:PAS domain S-box-containing protein